MLLAGFEQMLTNLTMTVYFTAALELADFLITKVFQNWAISNHLIDLHWEAGHVLTVDLMRRVPSHLVKSSVNKWAGPFYHLFLLTDLHVKVFGIDRLRLLRDLEILRLFRLPLSIPDTSYVSLHCLCVFHIVYKFLKTDLLCIMRPANCSLVGWVAQQISLKQTFQCPKRMFFA